MSIEYNDFLKECRDDDVISLSSKVYKLKDFIKNFTIALNNFLGSQDSTCAFYGLSDKLNKSGIIISKEDCILLCNKGANSETLKIASDGWKKGKLKINITVEFIPDEPELPEYQSPLDEIRNHPSFPNS